MKEKITKLKDWYNSLNSTKQKLVKYGIIAFLSSFLGGYFAESAYRVSTNGLLELKMPASIFCFAQSTHLSERTV